MKSYYAYTDEIDDLELAAHNLKAQLEKPLKAHTVGILIVDFETDVEVLIKELRKVFDFDFIGGTSIGMLGNVGYKDLSISMLVLTDDEVDFDIGITRDMKDVNDLIGIDKMYEATTNARSEKASLIFALGALAGNGWEVGVSDDFVMRLSKLSDNTPIVGGIAGDDMNFSSAKVFTNLGWVRSGFACLFFYGRLKPIYRSEKSISNLIGNGWTVTKSKGGTVNSLDGKSVRAEFAKLGLAEENADVITNFLSLPFLNTMATDDGDQLDLVRSLSYLDGKNDCCGFMANVKEGSYLACGSISEQVVRETVRSAFDDVLAQIEREKDYEYSTILCISCIARYCIIAANNTAEADGFVGRIPEGINLTGFYSFGEIMPVKGKKTGRYFNSFCNETFAVVAI